MAATTPDGLISLGELRSALAASGVVWSDRQLKRLRVEGLLLCAGQRHPLGLRGSESVYPRSAVEQLELVAGLGRREGRFVHLRILVAWHGGWVEPELLRASLAGLLERVSVHARALVAGHSDEGDQADRLAQAMRLSPGRTGAARLMRARLAQASTDVERLAYALAGLAVRAEIEWENHNPADPIESLGAVFERASGIDRARRDSIAGSEPFLRDVEPTPAILDRLQQAGCFDLLDLGRAFRQANDESIGQAFTDARRLAKLASFFDALQAAEGEDVAGVGSLTQLVADDLDAWAVAVIVRNFLLLQSLVPSYALETIARAAEEARPSIEAVLEIRAGLPQYADFVGVDGPRLLAALPAAERERITSEIRVYVERHPGLRARVNEITR